MRACNSRATSIRRQANIARVAPRSKKANFLKKPKQKSPGTVLVLVPGECKSKPRREADVQPARSTMSKGVHGTVKGPLHKRKKNTGSDGPLLLYEEEATRTYNIELDDYFQLQNFKTSQAIQHSYTFEL